MRLPKPKSIPGLLLYGITAICLVLFGQIAWVVIGQNIENVSADKGFDKLLSVHLTEIMAWLGENGFWLSLAFAFFLGATIALWINLGLQEWIAKRAPSSLSETLPIAGSPSPDPKIAQLQGELDKSKHKIEMLAAAEKARLDLALVLDLLGAIDALPEVTPIKFGAEGAPQHAYYEVSLLESQIRNATYGKDAWSGFGEAIAAAVAALDGNNLNFVAEEHERALFGTNAGKQAFMIAKAKVDGARAFVKNKEAELNAIIKSAADLRA